MRHLLDVSGTWSRAPRANGKFLSLAPKCNDKALGHPNSKFKKKFEFFIKKIFLASIPLTCSFSFFLWYQIKAKFHHQLCVAGHWPLLASGQIIYVPPVLKFFISPMVA